MNLNLCYKEKKHIYEQNITFMAARQKQQGQEKTRKIQLSSHSIAGIQISEPIFIV